MFVRSLRGAAAALALAPLVLAAPAWAQGQTVTLSDLRYSMGFGTVVIPRLEVRGTPLAESELRAILDPAAPGDVGARLQRLQAQAALMPEIIVETDLKGQTSRTVYRDVRIANIAAGVVGETTAAGATGESSDPRAGAARLSMGAIRMEALDLPLVARVIVGASPDPSREPLAPIYRTLTYADYAMELPGGLGQMSIRRVAATGFKARPGREPLNSAVRGLMEFADRQQDAGRNARPSPQDMVVMGQFFSIFENFEYGVMDIEDFRGRFGEGDQRAEFRIAAMRFSDQSNSAGFGMRDMRVEAGPARFVMAELEARDFAVKPTFRAVAELLQSGNPQAFERDWHKLIPQLGTIRIAGVEIVAPDPDARSGRQQQNQQPQTLRITARSAELGFGAQLDGIPTAMRFGAEDIVVPLSANSRDDNIRQMRAMGINEISLGWLADLAWRQAQNTLDVNALNVTIRDQMTAAISGRLGNVTREAFSTDAALAQVAWLSATAQQIRFSVQNSGLFERIVANEARKARKQPDQLRREWGSLAAIGLPAILGDSEGAKAIAGAVSRFIARPGALELEATSKAPAGLGLADAVVAAGNPQSLFDKVEIRANAR